MQIATPTVNVILMPETRIARHFQRGWKLELELANIGLKEPPISVGGKFRAPYHCLLHTSKGAKQRGPNDVSRL